MTKVQTQYFEARQTDALLIESLLSAAMAAAGAGRDHMVLDLVDLAHDAAKNLNNDLDSTALPDGEAA